MPAKKYKLIFTKYIRTTYILRASCLHRDYKVIMWPIPIASNYIDINHFNQFFTGYVYVCVLQYQQTDICKIY